MTTTMLHSFLNAPSCKTKEEYAYKECPWAQSQPERNSKEREEYHDAHKGNTQHCCFWPTRMPRCSGRARAKRILQTAVIRLSGWGLIQVNWDRAVFGLSGPGSCGDFRFLLFPSPPVRGEGGAAAGDRAVLLPEFVRCVNNTAAYLEPICQAGLPSHTQPPSARGTMNPE